MRQASDVKPEDALRILIEGNGRFIAQAKENPNQSMGRVREVSSGQHPFAIIVTCSDSRVPPEVIFDCGIGDIFVVRTAGHVVDDAALASIEFAVSRFGCNLVAVMGHSSCGAVKAAIEAAKTGNILPGSLRILISAINPSLVKADDGFHLEASIESHVRSTMERIGKSPVLEKLITSGKIWLIGLNYKLENGTVGSID
jgi:carbonic anhydrase